MECKICNKMFKGKIGLNTHLRTHKINYLDYYVKYENFIIPKCECGKDRKKNKIDFRFFITCGDINCIKKIQREKRISWLKANQEKTAWRLSNMSYPEKIFNDKCIELDLHKTHLIIREKSVFPYFIDFAFQNEMVAVEIDGSQHNLIERKKSDQEKDALLISLGWKVIRFTAKEIQTNTDFCFNKLLEFIKTNKQYEVVGIIDDLKKVDIQKEKLNKEREKNKGLTNLQLKESINQRKTKRPPYNILIQEVKKLGYSAVGRKYGVSDNSIRKWVKTYEQYGI